MVASTKVARYISEQLQLPLIWDESIKDHRDLDILILINGAYAFCKWLEALSYAIVGAKRIIWVQQDYTIITPINNGQATSPFRRAFVQRRLDGKPHLDYWTTCLRESKSTPLSRYINWNCLSMQEIEPLSDPLPILVYYGSFRAGRTKYFDQFFRAPQVAVMISSPSKKFEQIYMDPKINHCRPPDIDLILWLRRFGLGLYLEDRKSHSEYHSPPNRFYEMLSAHLPMVFQQQAGSTFLRAGYKGVEDFTVNTALNIRNKMDAREAIGKQQYKLWHAYAMAERKDLSKNVKNAWTLLRS